MLSEFKERLKIIFYKSTFDFDSPDITLARYHPQLYYLLAMNGIFFNDSKSLVRFLWPAICVSLSFVAIALEGLVVVHALMVGDAALFTESFAYTLIMAVVPILFYCTLRKEANIKVFLALMDEDFKNNNVVGEPFKSLFMAKQLNIWQCGCSWLLFVIFVLSCYILLSAGAIIFYCLFSTHNEDTRRPLIFPLWLPYDDPQLSPLYEIFMFLQYLAICDFVSCFTTYVYILFHLLLRSYFTLDLVMLGIERLFDDVDGSTLHERYDEVKGILQARIKRIVTWHNSVFDNVTSVVDIYGPVLAYQVVLSSLVICLITLYISIQLKEGAVDILVSLLAVGSLLQLWIPCYIGSLMSIKGMQVSDCCFYSGWYTHNARLVRIVLPDILMIMMRAQRPIVIQVAALPPLQLETFSSILSTAYTYFNMLSQRG